MQEEVVNTILKELREFRTEENKRWEANEKRWEENTKVISELNVKVNSLEEATKENTKAIFELKTKVNEIDTKVNKLETLTKENTQSINNLSQRLENNKLGIMDKSISERLDKIYKVNFNNDVEHAKIKKALELLSATSSKTVKRVEKLEDWKNSIDGSLFAV